MTDYGKIVSARLTESELSALNMLMQKYGCKSLADLLLLLIDGKLEVGSSSVACDIAEIKSTLLTIVDNFGVEKNLQPSLITNNEVSSGGWTFRRELCSTPFEPPLCGYLTNLVMSPPG